MEKAPNADAYIDQQKNAIAANPDCGTSHYNLGVALLGQGKIEEAEKSLYAAIECSPAGIFGDPSSPVWPKPTSRLAAFA